MMNFYRIWYYLTNAPNQNFCAGGFAPNQKIALDNFFEEKKKLGLTPEDLEVYFIQENT